MDNGSRIHPTAVIDPSAEIGEGVTIGPYSFIGPQVRIGARSRLHHHVSIMSHTTLGEENLLYPGVVLGADPQDKKFEGEESWLRVGERNTFREHVTVHRGTGLGGGETRIGSHCFIMAGSHIAHDCVLGNSITIANSGQLAGHIHVEDHVGLGGMIAVHHYVTIGKHAFLGGLTRVVRDVPPFMLTEGNPARVRATNRVGLKRCGFTEEQQHWLKQAHRFLFYDGLQRDEAVQKLKGLGELPDYIQYLLDFLSRSDRGNQGRALQP